MDFKKERFVYFFLFLSNHLPGENIPLSGRLKMRGANKTKTDKLLKIFGETGLCKNSLQEKQKRVLL